jgi:hypothetical protein
MFAEDGYIDPARMDALDFLMNNPDVDEDGSEIDLPDDEVDLPFDDGLPPFQSDETPLGEMIEGE